jgi:K+-transporting ATPase ATPase A chain
VPVEAWAQLVVFAVVLTALTPLVGAWLHAVYTRPARGWEQRLLGPVQQSWWGYARSVLVFSAAWFVALLVVLRTQPLHPWNPLSDDAPMPWDLAINTTASFVTNTNWQFYGGETTLSYVSQMAGLAVQNFVSAAVGIAVLVAVVRGLAGRGGDRVGNFHLDVARTLLLVLLPLSVVGALVLLSQGVPQTLATDRYVGPVASQEAIKLLGTNGGGFFNVNSAHPFENPSGLTNLVEMLLILLIPAGLTSAFGRMVGNRRQGWAIYTAMLVVFLAGVVVVALAESSSTPAMQAAGLDGPNLEGKETRFGIGSSALFAVVTTVASCGAVNAAMESLTGLGGAVPMANMMTGEVIFGGVGSGLYGMLLFVLLAVFLAGLMVGRTPEYLGKKIEAREVRIVALATLAVPLVVLAFTAFAVATDLGRASVFNSGPQGFSETLYAYASQANNNGSAFAGYTAFLQPEGGNTGSLTVTFSQLLGALAMLAGRFLPMVAVLAVAGSLAGKRVSPPSTGTMRTDTATFVVLLIATVLLVALLTFVPSLLLGPIAQGLTDRLFG